MSSDRRHKISDATAQKILDELKRRMEAKHPHAPPPTDAQDSDASTETPQAEG